MATITLSNSSSGSVKEVFLLSVPVFFSLVSSNLMLFFDRFFLARFSLEAFNAVGFATYLILSFQITCIRFSSISQVFVGRCLGEKAPQNIGPYTWQMIWGSLLTFFVITPIGIIASELYFSNTEVEVFGKAYFSIMLFGNFLFPLGATLASFQLGLGKTKVVLIAALVSNFLNVVLDYYLINGILGILSPLGVKGAAIATLLSQIIYCSILFFLFINQPLKKEYKTNDFYFRAPLFKEISRSGITSAFARLTGFLFWIISMNIVANKGGDYILLISFGSTICILNSTISESLTKAMTTFFSYFLGQNNWKYVWKSLRSGIILLMAAFCLLAIPFTIYNNYVIEVILGTKIINAATMNFLRLACYWLWIHFLVEGISNSIIYLLIAMKKTLFLFKSALAFTFLAIYLPYYFAFKIGNFSPDKIWVISWIACITASLVNLIKVLKVYKKSQLGTFQKNLI